VSEWVYFAPILIASLAVAYWIQYQSLKLKAELLEGIEDILEKVIKGLR